MKTIRTILSWVVLTVVCLGETNWNGMPFKELRKEARDEVPEAMLEMGRRCAEADGGVKRVDLEDAFDWYLKAAEAGVVEAQHYVAKAYREGIGVQSNSSRAQLWERKAKSSYYERGLIIQGDPVQVCRMFEQKMKNGELLSPEEQLKLADAYVALGKPAKAMESYKASLQCKFHRPYERIGDLYRQGLGVDQNDKIALEWYLKGAEEEGVCRFMADDLYRKIAEMYEQGLGTEPDKEKALLWHARARQNSFQWGISKESRDVPEVAVVDWPDKPTHTFTERPGEKYEAIVKNYSPSTQTVLLETADTLSVKKKFSDFCEKDQAYILDWKVDDLIFSGGLKVDLTLMRGESAQTKSGSGSYSRVMDVMPVSYELEFKNREPVSVTDLTVGYYVIYEIKDSSGKFEGKNYHEGCLNITDLGADQALTLTTDSVKMRKEQIGVSYSYSWELSDGQSGFSAGGKSVTEENLEGIVVRIYRKGRLLKEVSEPSSLAKRIRNKS